VSKELVKWSLVWLYDLCFDIPNHDLMRLSTEPRTCLHVERCHMSPASQAAIGITPSSSARGTDHTTPGAGTRGRMRGRASRNNQVQLYMCEGHGCKHVDELTKLIKLNSHKLS